MDKNDTKLGINEVRARLHELISNMSEAGARELMKELEKRAQSKPSEKRKYPRKQVFSYVECVGDGCDFSDFIQDISAGGLFVETQIPFFIGQELTMTFSFPDADRPTQTTGKVVRIDSKGLGVKFDEPIPEI